jgi:hypothetical protein
MLDTVGVKLFMVAVLPPAASVMAFVANVLMRVAPQLVVPVLGVPT